MRPNGLASNISLTLLAIRLSRTIKESIDPEPENQGPTWMESKLCPLSKEKDKFLSSSSSLTSDLQLENFVYNFPQDYCRATITSRMG